MDSISLSTADSLAVNEANISVAIDGVALVQASVLVPADLAVLSAMDSVVLALNSVLDISGLLLSVAVGSVTLDQTNLLVVADMTIQVLADSPVLLQQNALSINDARLSILMDSLTIGGGVFVTESALGMIVRDFQYVFAGGGLNSDLRCLEKF